MSQSRPADVLRELERIPLDSRETGLAFCAAAARALSERLPLVTAKLESKYFRMDLSSMSAPGLGLADASARLSILVNSRRSDGDINVHLLGPTASEFSVAGLAHSSIKTKAWSIEIEGRYVESERSERRLAPSGWVTTADELSMLTRMAFEVVQRLREDMRFESYEGVPQRLAEALVRTVRFASDNMSMHKVVVGMSFVQDKASTPERVTAVSFADKQNLDSPAEPPTNVVTFDQFRPSDGAHSPDVVQRIPERAQSNDLGLATSSDEGLRTSGSKDSSRTAALESSIGKPQNGGVDVKERTLLGRLPVLQSLNERQDREINQGSGTEKTEPLHERSSNDRVFIALGSNVGNRLQIIEQACRELDAESTTRILRTSALYETDPMYVENQDRFLNGVCEASSSTLKNQVLVLLLTESGRNHLFANATFRYASSDRTAPWARENHR